MRATITFVVLVMATAVAGFAIPSAPKTNGTVPICHPPIRDDNNAKRADIAARGQVCEMGGF